MSFTSLMSFLPFLLSSFSSPFHSAVSVSGGSLSLSRYGMQSFSLALQLLAFSFPLPFSALMRLTSSSFYWSLGSPLLPVRSSWSLLIPENHYNQTVAQNSFCPLSSLPPTAKDFGNDGAASLCGFGLICVSCYLCELVKKNKWQRDKLMVVVWSTPGVCPPFANLQTLCPNANIGLAFVGPSGVNLIEEGLASVKPRCGAVRYRSGIVPPKRFAMFLQQSMVNRNQRI